MLSPITRAVSWALERRKWLFSAVSGGIWTPHSPVLIKISADKRSLSQLTVKILVFSLIIKTFCHQHHRMVHEKAINVSVWIKEICTLLWKFHIIFSRMQSVNQHARPSIIQVGWPTCCYQVCALDHAKGRGWGVGVVGVGWWWGVGWWGWWGGGGGGLPLRALPS